MRPYLPVCVGVCGPRDAWWFVFPVWCVVAVLGKCCTVDTMRVFRVW